MPDPRSEPLLGTPLVGDVAYMILMDKGVPDLLPGLAHRKWSEMRMDDWFLWPRSGNHRARLQAAVRAWLEKHPECCTAPKLPGAGSSPKIKNVPDSDLKGSGKFRPHPPWDEVD